MTTDIEYNNTLIRNELFLSIAKICGESLHKLQQPELPGRLGGRIILRKWVERSSLAKLGSLPQGLSLLPVDGSTRISVQSPVL